MQLWELETTESFIVDWKFFLFCWKPAEIFTFFLNPVQKGTHAPILFLLLWLTSIRFWGLK